MKFDNISKEIGRLIYLCCEQYVPADVYDVTERMIEELKNKLDLELVVEGIQELWDEYGTVEITSDDIVQMLEQFDLSFLQ